MPLDELRERGRRISFAAGERILSEGTSGDEVALILAGRVKISHTTTDGREAVLDFRGPGELIGELSALDDAPRSSSVTAIEPVEAAVVAASEFRALLERPGFATELLRVLAARFRNADRKRLEFGESDTVGRVCARLAELAERYGERDEGALLIALPISQDELAGWTAASRAGLANALRTLRDLGWIETDRRRIRVLDLDAVRMRSGKVQN